MRRCSYITTGTKGLLVTHFVTDPAVSSFVLLFMSSDGSENPLFPKTRQVLISSP